MVAIDIETGVHYLVFKISGKEVCVIQYFEVKNKGLKPFKIWRPRGDFFLKPLPG